MKVRGINLVNLNGHQNFAINYKALVYNVIDSLLLFIMKSSLQFLTLFMFLASVIAGPEPLDDYANTNFIAANFLLKNLSSVGANIFPGGRTHRTSTGVLPGVTTLGSAIGVTVLKFKGLITPHFHPRATELLYVVSGRVRTGFLNGTYGLFENSLQAGDVQVFPRGSIHWFANAGNTDLVVIQSFDAQNPGAVYLNKALEKIPLGVLRATFQKPGIVVSSVLKNPALNIIELCQFQGC